MSFIPSCDNDKDALLSISKIYGVEENRVYDLIGLINKADYSYWDLAGDDFSKFVCDYFEKYPSKDIKYAYFYHTTSYNGKESWFNEGILGSSRSIEVFLNKTKEFIPVNKFNNLACYVRAQINTRSEYESAINNACGPYSWSTLSGARNQGINYIIPESIRDFNDDEIEKILRLKLIPVILKFKGLVKDINLYSSTLIAYLYSKLHGESDFHLSHQHICNGETIPKENISEFIELVINDFGQE